MHSGSGLQVHLCMENSASDTGENVDAKVIRACCAAPTYNLSISSVQIDTHAFTAPKPGRFYRMTLLKRCRCKGCMRQGLRGTPCSSPSGPCLHT